jgi:hypothetical protein
VVFSQGKPLLAIFVRPQELRNRFEPESGRTGNRLS